MKCGGEWSGGAVVCPRRWRLFAAIMIILGSECQATEPVLLSGRAMGTVWSAKFVPPSQPLDPDALKRRMAERLEILEQQFSLYRELSELSRFNAAASTEWRPVSPELARVVEESRRVSAITAGAFDATVAPLVTLWGFGSTRRVDSLPSESEIATARSRVGWAHMEARLDPPALRKKRADLAADFSSMAKGFSVDALAEMITSAGVTNFLVQLGGDMRASGGGLAGAGWRVGIEQPEVGTGALAGVVTLEGQSLSTSGNTRNFITVNSRRFGHLIDPRTGWPASNNVAAVTVVHASCAWSSALATGLFVLGEDEGFRVAARERLACQFLIRNGADIVRRRTPEFERLAR